MSTPNRRAGDPKTLTIRNVGYATDNPRRRGYVVNVEVGGMNYHLPEGSDTELPEELARIIEHRHGAHGLLIVHAPETGRLQPETPEPPAIEKRRKKKSEAPETAGAES
jgi:hypothetical protein